MRHSIKTISTEELRKLIKESVVESDNGCWIWKGETLEGLAIFKRTTAARAAYQAFVGPIPGGKRLYHGCDKTLCVYPGHLTFKQSTIHPFKTRMHCKRGHEYTPENTRMRDSSKRICKACVRIRREKWLNK